MSANKTCDTSITKCLTNIELVTNICKYLNCEQQWQLLQVSRALKHIIVNFIWKIKFKEVEVFVPNKKNFYFISNKIDPDIYIKKEVFFFNYPKIFYKNKFLLQSNEMENFLNLNAGNITRLHIKYNLNMTENVCRYPFLKHINFINLNFLRCDRVTLRNKDLRKVAKDCINLETLALINCLNEKNQPLTLDADIDVQVFKSMFKLKNLIIRFSDDKEPLHRFSNVRTILNELKLQCFILDFPIYADDNSIKEKDFSFTNLEYCNILEIGHCEKVADFINFQTNILPNLENLCNLTLNHFSVTKKFLNILLTSCKYLTHLSFYSCRIKEFIALPQLQELNIYFCEDTTWLNLKTILSEMHLKCFKSISTRYEGYLDLLFFISTTLEKLHCDLSDRKFLQLLEFNKENLQNLSYFHWDIRSPAHFSLWLSVVAPNLTVLHIPQQQLNTNDCYQMKFLQKLFLDLYDSVDVSQSLLILKHKNLRELTIKDWYARNENVDYDRLKAFKTNILYLNICGRALDVLTDFCLDLLRLNRKLSLTCFGLTNTNIILKVLQSDKFRSRFASINICGISIDCSSIQKNCTETLNLIKLLVDVFKYSNEECYFKLE